MATEIVRLAADASGCTCSGTSSTSRASVERVLGTGVAIR
jgi:hypothetical protein